MKVELTPNYTRFINIFNKLRRVFYENDDTLCFDDIELIKKHCPNLEVYSGCTRFCVKDKKSDIILKCNYTLGYKNDEQEVEMDEKYVYNFPVDYCESERMFRDVIIGQFPMLTDIFLPLYKIPYKRIYFQDRVILKDDYKYGLDIETVTTNKKFMDVIRKTKFFKRAFVYKRRKYTPAALDGATFFLLSWYYDVYKYYDEKILDMLFRAIELYKIKDLHPDNVGYLNGKPIILDYIGIM